MHQQVSSPITCTKCQTPVQTDLLRQDFSAQCHSCGSKLQVVVFPALFRPLAKGQAAEHVVMDEQASCFYHPDKKAVVPCSTCGRFLCSLCDVVFENKHICPSCLAQSQQKGKTEKLEKRRVLWDDVALSLILLSVLFFPISLFTAPAALFIAVRNCRKPGSMVRGKQRYAVAITLSLAIMVMWGIFLVTVFT